MRYRERLHPDHPDSLEARAQQARASHDAGRIAEAIAIMERVMPDAKHVRGDDHPFTSDVCDTLADWHRRTTSS